MNSEERSEQRAAQRKTYEERKAQSKTPEGRYKNARGILLAVALLTLATVGLQIAQLGYSLYLSAFLPQYAMGTLDGVWGIAAALAGAGLLALCWALSKKTHAFLVVGLALFLADTVALGAYLAVSFGQRDGSAASWVFDAVFHALILYYLVRGALSIKQVKAAQGKSDAEITRDIARDTDQSSWL